MKIVFSDNTFQDNSRVGYDYSFPTYSIESGDTAKNSDEIVVPEHFTIEKARKLGEAMIKHMMDGYCNSTAYKLAMNELGEKI
ncbi:MAG: hypothetical protein E7622_04530 [Ruminococcaceae bacterium]|nr:hypothetical protein [Oscillospiraceae bacterium]